MGIKDVWNILQPYCQRKPIFELENKAVAIDLAGWVCQAQNIAEYQVQPKMYLRNLYFRTCFLLLHDVQMVFVLEGIAPKLKYKTIAARNVLQFKGAEPRSRGAPQENKQNNKGRSRFNGILKQCKEMLKLMGLACVTGEGEAEAMCACLNKNGLVEGCISQDSDCFAYGAHVVYRNFSISMQGNQAGAGGSIDVYDLRLAEREMGFGRNKVITMALLCGSDYNDGVFGVGKESALKFFEDIPDKAILDRIRSWKTKKSHYASLDRLVNDRNNCSNCSHVGKKAVHTKKGCMLCGTHSGCNINEEHMAIRHECSLRQKALLSEDFPSQELIEEFVQCKETVPTVDFHWRMPDLIGFIDFTRTHLQWEEIYAFEKFMPILTRWIISHPNTINLITLPDYIKKSRAPKGIASYEIVWKSEKLLPLIPKDQLEQHPNMIKVFSTIEPKHLIDQSFPLLVKQYEESKSKPKKAKRQKLQKTLKTTQSQTPADDSLLCDDDGADLSLIIDEIVDRGVPLIFRKKINELLKVPSHKDEVEASSSDDSDDCGINNLGVSSIFQNKIDFLLLDQSAQELSFIELNN